MQLDEWMAAKPEHRRLFEQSRKAFGYLPASEPDTEKRLQEILRKPAQSKPRIIELQPWIRIAAAVILVLSVSLLIVSNFYSPPTIYTSNNKAATHQLADGSVVTLQANAELSVVKTGTTERRVKLRGNAQFIVKHNADSPFVVEVDDLLVKDIGTQFTIQSSPDQIVVAVTEGEVELNAIQQSVRLIAGESASYILSKHRIIPQKLPPATTNLRFRSATLEEVVDQVNQKFGKVLKLDHPGLNACTITVSFNDETPDWIAQVIAETLGLTVEERKGVWILKGKGCAGE